MEKLQKIYEDKMFLHGNNVYNLDIERTQRYAIVHQMESNPILFGVSDTGIKLRVPIENCEAIDPSPTVEKPDVKEDNPKPAGKSKNHKK